MSQALRMLVAAYAAGAENGGSIDWSDLDDAYNQALKELGRDDTDDQFTHECGGTILTGGSGDQEHSYCDRCGAFRYTIDSGPFPNGTDKDANDGAWDAGETRSPSSAHITDEAYVEAACKLHHRDGDCEIDAGALVSRGEDAGAYVQAWIWVDDDDVDTDDEPLTAQELEAKGFANPVVLGG